MAAIGRTREGRSEQNAPAVVWGGLGISGSAERGRRRQARPGWLLVEWPRGARGGAGDFCVELLLEDSGGAAELGWPGGSQVAGVDLGGGAPYLYVGDQLGPPGGGLVDILDPRVEALIIMANSETKMILAPRWYTVAQVVQLLNYGERKVRMLIITGQLRSIKDGRSRRILPEWVEAYVQDRAKSTEDIW